MAETGVSKSELVVGRCYAGSRTGQPQKRRAPEGACTRELLERFIEVLTDTCNVTEAARAVDRTTGVIYRWRQKDPAFRAAWDRALDAGFAALEMELLRRARFGQDVTEYRTGEDGKEVPVKRVHSYCNRLGLAELFALRPERVSVEADARGWPMAYLYRVGENVARLASEDAAGRTAVVHLKSLHPLDDHYGLGCVGAAAGAVAIHNAATVWNKALLDNAARPSGALVFDPGEPGAVMSPEQFDRIKAEMEAGFQGAANAGRPMLLEGGLKWQAISLSPADMDFVALKAAAAREIALAFGVPPMLMGLPGDNAYANYREANRALWRQTILPLSEKILGGIAQGLGPWMPGVRLAVDLNKVPALVEERGSLWDRVSAADFRSREEKRAMLGVSRLLRGRRGTEWAIAGHVGDESFLLIEADALVALPDAYVRAGSLLTMLALGVGDVEPAEAALTVSGEALKPPSPVHLTIEVDGLGDRAIRWTRRSRSGWAWADYVDVPLGEEAERYRFRVMAGEMVVRSVEMLAPEYAYSAAMAAADEAAGGSALTLEIVQIGARGISRPLVGVIEI